MSDESRRYRKRKRARQEEETRKRITEAVMELHRTVGPALTKVTEVAERAGVSRMTVYNHFPTEGDLIEACSSHWAARNPFPDPAAWAAVEDPHERLHAALSELYGWYGRTEDMMGNVLRDISIVEPLREIMDERWSPYMDAVVDVLAEGWDGPGASPDNGSTDRSGRISDGGDVGPRTTGLGAPKAELRAALRVVVDFRTWRLLVEALGGDAEAADVAARMVDRVASPSI